MRILPSAFLSAALASSLALAAACGGESPQPQAPMPPATPSAEPPAAPTASAPEAPSATPPATASAEAPAPPPVPTAWSDDLPKPQKAAFMKAHVMPNMSKVFQAFDAKRYETFTCATCHGEEFKPRPQDALPKLTFKGGKLSGPAAKHPDVAKFMGEKVTPEMARTLGEPPFDMKTMKGFGCGGCHSVEMVK